MLIVPPTSRPRRCTLKRTYRERNSVVWCGTVQCTFSCSLLRRISPYTLFYYDKSGNYTLSRNTRGWYAAYTRVPLYTPNTPLEPIKNFGGLGKIWGACAPWPQPKTATGHADSLHSFKRKLKSHFLACNLMTDSVMPFRSGFAHGGH